MTDLPSSARQTSDSSHSATLAAFSEPKTRLSVQAIYAVVFEIHLL